MSPREHHASLRRDTQEGSYCAQFKTYHDEMKENENEEPHVTEAELARAIEHTEKVASEAQGRCSQEHASARIAELERRVEELTDVGRVTCVGDGTAKAGCGYIGGKSGFACPKCNGMLLSDKSNLEAKTTAFAWIEAAVNLRDAELTQLRAQVETLTRELEETTAYAANLAGIDADRDRLAEENENLRAQLAASEADRARIDKIEEMAKCGGPLAEHIDPLNDAAGNEHGVRVLVICLPYIATKRPETLRDAIDALYTGPIDAPLPDAARKEEA